MTFTRPTVGPKVYLSRGPSGHNETFPRAAADHALATLLGTRLKLTIDGFIRKMLLEQKHESWSDVIGYLGEMTKLDPDAMPVDVAVAFWAQVEEKREADKRAKLGAGKGN